MAAAFREDVEIYPVMLALAGGVGAEIDLSGLPSVENIAVSPGIAPALDFVGNGKTCSEIIVNLTNAYAVDGFPNPANDVGCGTEMAYEVQVGVFRCAPAPQGKPIRMPDAQEQMLATRLHLADMQASRRAICKALTGHQYILRGFTPYGPEGNVVGGVWLVIVGPETD